MTKKYKYDMRLRILRAVMSATNSESYSNTSYSGMRLLLTAAQSGGGINFIHIPKYEFLRRTWPPLNLPHLQSENTSSHYKIFSKYLIM